HDHEERRELARDRPGGGAEPDDPLRERGAAAQEKPEARARERAERHGEGDHEPAPAPNRRRRHERAKALVDRAALEALAAERDARSEPVRSRRKVAASETDGRRLAHAPTPRDRARRA